MAKNLKNFHFDQEKSARILNGWAKDAGVSIKKLGDETGYTFDTINNTLHGKVKDLSLERVFKIAASTGHSVCEYIILMLQDEDIDFAHQVYVLQSKDTDIYPLSETSGNAHKPKDTSLVQTGVFDQNSPEANAVSRAMMEQSEMVHHENIERIKSIYEKNIGDQARYHDEHIETIRRLARQRLRWIIILTVILLAFIFWFIWDLSQQEIGLIRLSQIGYFGHHFMGLLR